MERKSISIGKSDFKRVIKENYYYIDKTMFIEEILRRKSEITLVTRPRRFGKTLNMTTLKYFLDIENRETNRELFRGLNIEKTEYISEQGKYPVIFITMKELTGLTYQEFLEGFKVRVSELYADHEYLREKLGERDLKEFDRIWYRLEDGNYKEALSFLIKLMYKYYGVNPVLLIDEYDTPMIYANEKGYYEEVKELIGTFYGSALKNGICAFAVVTGILKIAKESIFSTLNNLKVSTILTGDYNYFGMTENEVIEILKYYGWETTLEETKRWYNGYLFGSERIYNPWSILSHCEDGKLQAFWVNTSANTTIKNILKNADSEIYSTMHGLMKEGKVLTKLDENIIFGQKYSDSTLLYLMFSAGYLTIDSRGEEEDEYYLTIPNDEVKKYFKNTFIDIMTSDSYNSFSKLEKALLTGNVMGVESIEEIIQRMFLNSISYMDLKSEERFYHNIIMGMLSGIDRKFYVHSNRESGLGRYDLAIEPKDKSGTGYIFEFKVAKTQRAMDKMGKEALEQIEKKIYENDMRDRGIEKIIKIGLVFCGKTVKIYS